MFERKTDALRWEAEQLAARERGDWVDPKNGRITLQAFFDDWSPRQIWELGTHRAMSGDIDFLRRTLKVRRQVQRAGGKNVEIGPPKYGSERDVYLPDELVKDLSGHISRNNLRGKLDAWLFSGEGNLNPPHQNTVGATWRRTCARVGVSGYTLHDLRHFFASAMIASGCDVVTVQRAMGHASATTTLRTYAHLWPTAEDRTRKSASDLINSVRHASLVKSRQDHRQQIGNTDSTF